MIFKSLILILGSIFVMSCSTQTCAKDQLVKRNEDTQKTVSILEGQKMSHFKMFQDKAEDKENAWDNWFDGSDLRGWWD